MRSMGASLSDAVAKMGSDESVARLRARTLQVHARYRDVIESVCDSASAKLILAHTNSVFIYDDDGVRRLVAYVDESIFAAELNARRELVRLRMHQLFSEGIGVFDIRISRGDYKNRHPFSTLSSPARFEEPEETRPLTCQEKDAVRARARVCVEPVDDVRVREALKRAVFADLTWKQGNRSNEAEKTKNGS